MTRHQNSINTLRKKIMCKLNKDLVMNLSQNQFSSSVENKSVDFLTHGCIFILWALIFMFINLEVALRPRLQCSAFSCSTISVLAPWEFWHMTLSKWDDIRSLYIPICVLIDRSLHQLAFEAVLEFWEVLLQLKHAQIITHFCF